MNQIDKLHQFLKDNETHLYRDNDDNLIGYIYITFDNIETFANILGENFFEKEYNNICKLHEDCIAIEIDNILDYFDEDLVNFKNCFGESEWISHVWQCYSCGVDIPEYVPEMCCDGHECGCMGQPINPPLCDKCYGKLFDREETYYSLVNKNQEETDETVIIPY